VLGVSYGYPIDMWSAGCVIAELHIGYPLFPAEDEKDLMSRMLEIMGMPPDPVLKVILRTNSY
jgi:serine/threonine protein kinase